MIGSNIVSRDYCREALNGHVFISRIQRVARGKRKQKGDAESPVMFISSPLMDSDNFIVGSRHSQNGYSASQRNHEKCKTGADRRNISHQQRGFHAN